MAETIYTKDEINRIHIQKTAVRDQIYTDVEGNKYVGTSEKTLVLTPNASRVIYNTEEGAITVGEALDNLGSRVDTIESTMATDTELATEVNNAKCLAIAMAMIL